MIGLLRTRLGLYAAQTAEDDLGGAVTTYQFQRALWGSIKPKTLSETRENGRLSVTQSYHVTIHYFDNFPERARLMWGERQLRIIAAADPDNRRERLHLICEEEQS